MHRAWRHFGRTAPWGVVWTWALRTAGNLLADSWRAAQRERIDIHCDLAAMTVRTRTEDASTPIDAMLGNLRTMLAEPEQQTLRLLVAGVHDNEAIAAVRGRRRRAVQESRRKIREAATRAWNNCRALHPRTSLLM